MKWKINSPHLPGAVSALYHCLVEWNKLKWESESYDFPSCNVSTFYLLVHVGTGRGELQARLRFRSKPWIPLCT